MSFITQQEVESILGTNFAPDGDKARLTLLANTWMKNQIGFVPDPIHESLKLASCEIIKGILAKVIYNGQEQLLKRKRVKAEVESEKEFQDGSVAISSFVQIALAFIDSVDGLKPKSGFSFEVRR